jgi:alginate O-acetyltransferase complex protein AlgI
VMIVFLISGFWHGANWTFVVWGAIHGTLYLAYCIVWPGSRRLAGGTPGGRGLVPSAWAAAQMAFTFGLTCVAWVFFRASSVTDAMTIVRTIATDLATTAPAITDKRAVGWIALLFAIEWIQRDYANPLHVEWVPRPVRWGLYYAVAVAIFLFAPLHYRPFIYFQF